jgi:hypothetical protein
MAGCMVPKIRCVRGKFGDKEDAKTDAKQMQKRVHFGHKGATPVQFRCKSGANPDAQHDPHEGHKRSHKWLKSQDAAQFRCSSGAVPAHDNTLNICCA